MKSLHPRLIGDGLMVNVYGQTHDATHSYVLALMPLAGLTVLSALAILYVGRQAKSDVIVASTAR